MHQLDKDEEPIASDLITALNQKQHLPLVLKKLTKIEEVPHARLLHSELYNTMGYHCLESYKPISLILKFNVK